ncbi:YetF domain-containing protein [Alkalihalobacillus deserti]|uniref:YetF domain-containing protein n=1 Tax=Alkalihalobacillus deserti TaxID=2879466 RepID=UPI003555C357
MKGLRKARLSKNELTEELRVKGFRSPSEVQQVFLEPNGKISVFEKSNQDLSSKDNV